MYYIYKEFPNPCLVFWGGGESVDNNMKYRNHNICIDTGYKTLKEAKRAAREFAVRCNYGKYYNKFVDIYQEPDGTYSIDGYLNGKAEYIMTIDKAGVKYRWQTVRRKDGTKRRELVEI